VQIAATEYHRHDDIADYAQQDPTANTMKFKGNNGSNSKKLSK
ncbi:hypothetical protein CCACVL1_30604, partial [Corchorus capsularis]